MTKLKEIYKCKVCGNIVEVLHSGPGELVCCGQKMDLLIEKKQEQGLEEKHLPIISQEDDNVKIQVGEIEHPMTNEHHIEWIEIQTKNKTIRRTLNFDEKPITSVSNIKLVDIERIRTYCNLHGLWETTLN